MKFITVCITLVFWSLSASSQTMQVTYDSSEPGKVASRIPVHREVKNIELGDGEWIQNGVYTAQSYFSAVGRKLPRNQVRYTARFDTDRWVMSDGSEVVYQHDLPGLYQLNASVTVQTGAYAGGKCLVEASQDGETWQLFGELDKFGRGRFAIPADLLPSEEVYVRLIADSSGGSFEIDGYSYRAELEDSPFDLVGETHYVEEMRTSELIQVTFETLGDLKPGQNNEVGIQVTNQFDDLLELDAILKIDGQAAEPPVEDIGEPTVVLDVGETWRVRWPKYEISQVGNHEMSLEIKDRYNNRLIYHARIPFVVPLLYEANYGGLLKQSAGVSIWWADGTRKISRGRLVPEKQDAIIRLRAAKNEYEPFQLVLRPERRLSQVKVEVSEFTNTQTDDTIPRQHIGVSVVDYIFVQVPTDSLGTRGYWPDPLPPHNSPLDLQPGQNQPFWITVHVPPGFPAGNYRGSITVRGMAGATVADASTTAIPEMVTSQSREVQLMPVDSESLQVLETSTDDNGQFYDSATGQEEYEEAEPEPLQVTGNTGEGTWSETVEVDLQVWDFTLPKETHVRSGFGLDTGKVKRYHDLTDDAELETVLDKYYQNYANHRISPYDPMSLHPIHIDFEGHWWLNGLQETATRIEGTYSLKVVDKKSDQNIAGFNKNLIPINSRVSYELGWRVKTEKPDQGYQVTVVLYDENAEILRGENIDLTYTGDGTWQREWVQIGWFPPNARFIRLNLHPVVATESGERRGTAWFDDLSLRRLPDGKNIVPDPAFERTVKDWEISLDYANFEKTARRYLDEFGFNAFLLRLEGMASGSFSHRDRGSIEDYTEETGAYNILFSRYLKQLQDYLEGNGWLDKAYVYWFDEPEPKDYDYVKAGMDRIHEAAPKLTRLLTEQVEPELIGSVDIWCPPTPNYSPADGETPRGEKFWWYLGTTVKSPYANLFIDRPAAEMRIWLWQTWKYKVDGIRVWKTNYWMSPAVYSEDELQNPYQDAMSYQSPQGRPLGYVKFWGNGDGRFLYPPKAVFNGEKSLDGPVNSIRWELLREGIEDYEYFWMLNEQIKQLKASDPQNPLIREAEGFLKIPETIVVSMTEFTKDAAPIYAHRSQLARMIDRSYAAVINSGIVGV